MGAPPTNPRDTFVTDSPDDARPDAAPSHFTDSHTGPDGSPPGGTSRTTGVEYLDSADGVSGAVTVTPAAPSRSGRRRGLVAGAVLAVGLIGGGVAYGVGQLSGGGAQPDEMVPSSALAIVSVDLDPSAGQKVDALRFARKFPDLKKHVGSGDDLRKAFFDAISDSSDVTASWEDVKPWLGDRAAVAVLPAADELDDPVPVVVVAVTDEAKAKAGLPKVVPDGSCEVADGFAVCAEQAETAKRALADAQQSSLADDPTYAKDVDALGDHGVLAAWADLGRLKDAAPDLLGGMGGVTGSLAGAATPDLQGRYVAALRFDGPNLELAGRVDGATLPRLSGSADAGSLPDDTLAAFSLGDAGTAVTAAWDRLRDAAAAMGGAEDLDAQVSTLAATYGVTLPDDLVSAVGNELTVVLGPGTTPQLAVRLGGSKDSVDHLLEAAGRASGVPVATATSGDGTVIASDAAYAKAVSEGTGLGGSDRFKDAVGDADGAPAVLFVDIEGLVSTYGDVLGLDAGARADLAPLSALGATLRQDGDALEYHVRLATR
jgi:hypothetical protein